MKRLTTLSMISLAGVLAFGQHQGGSISGGHAVGGIRAAGMVNTRPPGFSLRHRARRGVGFYPYAYPAFDYGYGFDYDYSPEPNVMVPPTAPPMIVQQALREVHSEIHEYAPPQQGSFAGTPVEHGEEPTFAIALADGSRRSASAVWVQNGFVHYVDSEDEHHQVPLGTVDRKLTRQINRDRNLNLWLPAAQ
jgi:hypothetical protein